MATEIATQEMWFNLLLKGSFNFLGGAQGVWLDYLSKGLEVGGEEQEVWSHREGSVLQLHHVQVHFTRSRDERVVAAYKHTNITHMHT